MIEDDPFKTVEFKDDKKLIAFLKKTKGNIDFFNCLFDIQGDVGEKLVSAKIIGVETLKPDQPHKGAIGWIAPGFFMSNVRFTKPVTFNQCKFSGPLYFNNVYFEEGCTFIDSDCENDVNFSEVRFLSVSQFRSIRAKQSVTFMKCLISSTQIGFRAGKYENGLAFYNTTIEGELDLGSSRIKNTLLIRQCTINATLNISDSDIEQLQLVGNDRTDQQMCVMRMSLRGSTITGQVQLNRIKVLEMFVADWLHCSDAVFIDRCRFCGSFQWMSAIFEKSVNINKTTFQTSLNFANSRFDDYVSIRRTDYENAKVYFDGAKFQSNLLIGANLEHHKISLLKGKLSFRSAVFESGTIVRIFGLNSPAEPTGEIDFTSALVKGLIDIRKVFLKIISFEGTVVTGNIQDNGSILPAIKDVASARLLKHESRKINNHLASLRYYRIEMNLYSKTLIWYKGDWWLFLLNRASNNFGLSWTRGVIFTLISGLCCYTFFRWRLNGLNMSEFWAGFINYFWLPTGFNELIESNPKLHVNGDFFGAAFYIFGKILIAYGIYQTVAAFRKHIQ